MSAPRKLTEPLSEAERAQLFGRIHRSPRIPDRYAQFTESRPLVHHSGAGGNRLAVTVPVDSQR